MKKSTEKYNPVIYSMSSDRPDSLKQREIHFLKNGIDSQNAGRIFLGDRGHTSGRGDTISIIIVMSV